VLSKAIKMVLHFLGDVPQGNFNPKTHRTSKHLKNCKYSTGQYLKQGFSVMQWYPRRE